MPELPEVETVRRGLQPFLEGQTLKSVVLRRSGLRIPFPKDLSQRLRGKTVNYLSRRAKYLLMHIKGGDTVIIHLGMSGHMTILINNIPKPGKHDHVDFCISTGVIIRFNDPRRFGLITITSKKELELHRFFRTVGPDPLTNHFNYTVLAAALVRRKTSVKVALLDQRIIAGLGNIYVSESLFRSGISPLRLAHSLKRVEIKKLIKCIREVLIEALEAGGSSLNDHVKPDGKLGYFQNKHRVYGKEGKICISCLDVEIKKIKQSGRSTFYCPLCQS